MRARTLLPLLLLGCAHKPAAVMTPPPVAQAPAEDPYLWLEDIAGKKSLDWVEAQNARANAELKALPGFSALRDKLRDIYDSKEQIPYVAKRGQYLVNLYKDATNPRGLWRRTTLAEYRKSHPKWETLVDIDALGRAENESWVFAGVAYLYPKYERALVSLSRGGSDAVVVREFDVVKKEWVQGGFTLPEAKTDVSWKDADTLYVGTNFGPGSTTASGYPRIVKEWKRGTQLADAKIVAEAKESDVAISVNRQHDHGRTRDVVTVAPTMFSNHTSLLDGGKLVAIDKPADADVGFWDDQILVTLRSDWHVGDKTWPAGALLVAPLADYLAGKRAFDVLFQPTPTSSLAGAAATKNAIFITTLDDVHNALSVYKHGKKGWARETIATPALASFYVNAWDDDENDDLWYIESGFLTPTTLSLAKDGKKREVLKRAPAFFDASNMEASQHFVTSKDGTRVPYFQVSKKGLALDGDNPTLIEGYGGFEVSLTPEYSATVGNAWLDKGGVYVVPNLRGGGEYGPSWHNAAVKAKRQNVYDDFAAVATDLIARKVTSPKKLGIKGGSNGGLLVGVMMTQRPDLFGAVVCQAALLDMKRYTKLLAGASWMDEYGDPDVAGDWAVIAKYSPYQNVKAGVRYPRILFTGSTRDDRVHPGHARKMMARMLEQGHDALFFENTEGGHGGAADNGQVANLQALAYSFLGKQLGL